MKTPQWGWIKDKNRVAHEIDDRQDHLSRFAAEQNDIPAMQGIVRNRIQILREKNLIKTALAADDSKEIYLKIQKAQTAQTAQSAVDSSPIDPNEALIQGYRYLQGMLLVCEGLDKTPQQLGLQVVFAAYLAAHNQAKNNLLLQQQALKKLVDDFISVLVSNGIAKNSNAAHKQLTLARDLGTQMEDHLPVCTTTDKGKGEYSIEYSEPVKISEKYYQKYFGYNPNAALKDSPTAKNKHSFEKMRWYQRLEKNIGFAKDGNWLSPWLQKNLATMAKKGVSAPPSFRASLLPANVQVVTTEVTRKVGDESVTTHSRFIRQGMLVPFAAKGLSQKEQLELAKAQFKEILLGQLSEHYEEFRKLYQPFYPPSGPSRKDFFISFQTFLSPFYVESLWYRLFSDNNAKFVEMVKDVVCEEVVKEFFVDEFVQAANDTTAIQDMNDLDVQGKLEIDALVKDTRIPDQVFLLQGDNAYFFDRSARVCIPVVKQPSATKSPSKIDKLYDTDDEDRSISAKVEARWWSTHDEYYVSLQNVGLQLDKKALVSQLMPTVTHTNAAVNSKADWPLFSKEFDDRAARESKLHATADALERFGNTAPYNNYAKELAIFIDIIQGTRLPSNLEQTIEKIEALAIRIETENSFKAENSTATNPDEMALEKERRADKAENSTVANPEMALEKERRAEMALRLRSAFYLRMVLDRDDFAFAIATKHDLRKDNLASVASTLHQLMNLPHYQRNIMLAALEFHCMGRQAIKFGGCKSARDRSAIVLAAQRAMMEDPRAMRNWSMLNRGIIKNLKEGHHFRSLIGHVAVVKISDVHGYFTAQLPEVREGVRLLSPFSKSLAPRLLQRIATAISGAWKYVKDSVIGAFGFTTEKPASTRSTVELPTQPVAPAVTSVSTATPTIVAAALLNSVSTTSSGPVVASTPAAPAVTSVSTATPAIVAAALLNSASTTSSGPVVASTPAAPAVTSVSTATPAIVAAALLNSVSTTSPKPEPAPAPVLQVAQHSSLFQPKDGSGSQPLDPPQIPTEAKSIER